MIIQVPILMHRAYEALSWLLERPDYHHPQLQSRIDTALSYWREIAKEGPSPNTIMFSFGQNQKELAMIFKMTWSG